ncbi:MAG: hypothetical protein UV78_C0006G0021 [Parcubacteria group bacterium GW2011_GWA2_43_17]|nr:MAG: hypothetical protein UV78_C0006G0021 [Parcubacteria group bacterium GW2011_GWA2_43_17]OHB43445.1 MAG: hypothetical protein A2Y13_03970 [Planctomycetes bacterium GWC2_45_44]HBR20294.1 hypothetical protein [Phycisphaerales bacterium]
MDIIQIADALAAKLITGTFSQSFTPVRTVFPNFELKELAALKVTIVPRSVDSSIVTRVSEQDDYVIDIGVQKKLTDNFEAEIEALISFVTEIKDFLKLKHLTMTTRVAMWINTKIDPIYSREHIAGDNVFTSVITVTYRMVG